MGKADILLVFKIHLSSIIKSEIFPCLQVNTLACHPFMDMAGGVRLLDQREDALALTAVVVVRVSAPAPIPQTSVPTENMRRTGEEP